MEIAKRLGLVIHWIGFVIGFFFFGLSLFAGLSGAESDGLNVSIYGLIFFLISTSFGWLIRYIIIGKIHFLPWKKS